MLSFNNLTTVSRVWRETLRNTWGLDAPSLRILLLSGNHISLRIIMDPEAEINSYIVESDPSERSKIASSLSKFPLIRVIKCLEDPLTQEDSLVRATATRCLTDLIKHKKDVIATEIKVLSIFLGDRLQDHDSTDAAAEGLHALLGKEEYAKANITDDILEKFNDLDMLHTESESRYQVYQFMLDLMRLQQKTAPVVNEKSLKIVKTFIALASGEKDPQNLMISLLISGMILNTYGFNLPKEIRAELFDITFCYFPVKFNPPKDMPYKITAEEIKVRLKDTISNPALAEWVIPSLISKLAAVSVVVKLDTLAALDSAVEKVAETGDLGDIWERVWDGIKFEVLHGTPESETYGPVLKTLSRFAVVPQFQDAVLKEFDVENLPSSKLYQLCCAVIGISTSEEIWDKLAPKAVQKCYDNPNALILFLNSPYNIPHLEQVFQSLMTAHANGDKKEATLGMKRVALSHNGQEYVSLIVQILTGSKEYGALAEIAEVYPEAIQEHCLPQLLSEFPEPSSLDALAKICCVRTLVHTLTVRLISRIDLNDQHLSLLILHTLVESAQHLKTQEELLGFHRVVTLPLLNVFSSYARVYEISDSILEDSCILLERASRSVPVDQQTKFVTAVKSYHEKVHFHLIFSSLVAMEAFPFDTGYIFDVVLPRLQTPTSDLLQRTAHLRLLAASVNKWYLDSNAFTVPLPEFNQSLIQSLKSGPNALEVFAWVTKGLLMRNDIMGFENAKILTTEAVSNMLAAKVFGVLLVPDRSLIKENGYTVRPLYRQRVFINSLPVLSENESSSESLVAVSSLLKYSPQPVVKSHFNKIFPLLLSSLSTKSEALQETALQTITSALPECGTSIEPQLDMLIPILLSIGTTARQASTRAAAFKGLCALREALPGATDGFRAIIKDRLALAVGDPNRQVRKYAVKCRQSQF